MGHEESDRHLVGGPHVRDADDQLAAVVDDGAIDAGLLSSADQVVDAHPGRLGALDELDPGRVAPHCGDQLDRIAQPGQRLGDVAADTTGRPDRVAGITGAGDGRRPRLHLEVHDSTSDDHDRSARGHQPPGSAEEASRLQALERSLDDSRLEVEFECQVPQ